MDGPTYKVLLAPTPRVTRQSNCGSKSILYNEFGPEFGPGNKALDSALGHQAIREIRCLIPALYG